MSRKRVARLRRTADLVGCAPRRFRVTTMADATVPSEDLVQRQFTATAPDQCWFGDITYVRTWEGWLYLAVRVDAFSRKVVGWAMAEHLRTELPLAALRLALATRQPAPGLIHHTDRGAQTGFKGSLQRRRQELRCNHTNVGAQIAQCELGCTHRVVHRWPAERIGSASGQRSPRA